MQNHTVTSSQRLERAKERLKDSLLRLENLIQKQNNSIHKGHEIRTQVIRNLDLHIENLGTILQNHN
jgi:hypothetical protein